MCALDVKRICDKDAVLFLWVTSPLLFECAPVIEAWGFTYRASIVWDKSAHNMGHYVSVQHEFLLICTRGSATPDSKERLRSVVSEKRGKHSVKPETFRTMIDSMYTTGKRIELFARTVPPSPWKHSEMSFNELLQAANTFEAYILWRIRAKGKRATLHETTADQLAHGDISLGSGDNLEIKLDRNYHKTGNLFIEVEEKHSADQDRWIASGIRCCSDAKWFGIGDYLNFFLFLRSRLQREQDSGRFTIIEISLHTSRGFLLNTGQVKALTVSTKHWSGMDPLGLGTSRVDSETTHSGPLTAKDIKW